MHGSLGRKGLVIGIIIFIFLETISITPVANSEGITIVEKKSTNIIENTSKGLTAGIASNFGDVIVIDDEGSTNQMTAFSTPVIQHGPYKQNVSGNKITIVWTTDENNSRQNWVEYGQNSGVYTHNVTATTVDTFSYWSPKSHFGNYRHEAVIESPWESGYYRVNSKGTYSSEYRYVVPGEIGDYDDDFFFIVVGDTRPGGTGWNNVFNNMKSREVSRDIRLLINAGDLEGYPTPSSRWRNVLEDQVIAVDHQLGANNWCVFYCCLGCHEYMSSSTTQVYGYRDVFTFPPNGCGVENGTSVEEQWYSFDYKNCHFIGWNSIYARWPAWSGVLPDYRVGSRQYNWLVSDLENASNDPDIDFIFVYNHHPIFSSTSYEYRYIHKDIRPLYDKYGVDVVFSAHQHTYHRSIRVYNNASAEGEPEDNGTTYYVTGGGGAELGYSGSGGWWTAHPATDVYHYLRCNVSNGNLTIEAVKHTDGSIIDTFTLNKTTEEESPDVYVDDDYNISTPGWGYDHFDSIQDGADAVDENGTVFVYNGTYYENIIIDKTLDLIGEDRNTTIIDGSGSGDNIVYVSADYVNISDFTICNSGYSNYSWNAGIALSSYNNIIYDVDIMNVSCGIYLYHSDNNDITDNSIWDSGCGITLVSSNDNGIKSNNVTDNSCGISVDYSENNNISDNIISNNRGEGIAVFYSDSNIFSNNAFFNDGFRIDHSYQNNISSNTLNGRPIVYLEQEFDIVIEDYAGQVILENCDNITIRNLELSNAAVGITVLYTDNCLISDNIITDTGRGLYLEYSFDNIICRNVISNGGTALRLFTSDNNLITENNVFNSKEIYLYSSDSNTIMDNNIINNVYGLYLQSCSNSIITSNNIQNNRRGIFLEQESDSNVIYENIIKFNQKGIYIYESNENTITGNNISENFEDGIRLNSSSNNFIYNNYFDNVNNAWDNGINFWNTIKTLGINIIGGPYIGGNYWSDYMGVDVDGDGFGDTFIPYSSNGNIQYGGDYLPLTSPCDQIPPEIQDNTPDTGYTGDSFTFNATITDAGGIDTAWVTWWYDSIALSVELNYIGNDNYEKTITIQDTLETFSYYISANDTSDNWQYTNTSYVTIYDNDKTEISDVQANPSIQNIGGYVNVSATVIDNIEVDEVYLYILYPDMSVENLSITQYNIDDTYYCNKTYQEPGVYTYHIWANDTSGNANVSADYTFEIINQPPYIPSDPYPENGATDISIYADLSWVGGDPDLDPVDYDVYFDTVSPPHKVVSNQSSTIYNPGTLEYFTTYYWQIVAWDNHDAFAEGPIWNFTTEEEYIPEPDLYCEGNLYWDGVEAGEPVTGSFLLFNVGDQSSLLDWEIADWPEWGTWAFTPDSGEDLTPEDGAVTVTVFVDAPDDPETEFFGEVRIVNTENSDDYYVIPVYLRTPVSQDSTSSQTMFYQGYIEKLMLGFII